MSEQENKMYQMISDKEEMRWFFDHCIFKPTITEMYTLEFVCRHKKLTAEEKTTLGLTRKEAEFLATQTVRLNKIKEGSELKDIPWNFEKFYRHVSRFNCSVEGYTTATGEPLPQKTLVVLCYVNPGDATKVADAVIEDITNTKTAIIAAHANGKTFSETAHLYQTFGNMESSVKHHQANCKGSRYWMDFDIDVPSWFKSEEKEPIPGYAGHSGIFEKEYANEPGFIYGTYLDALKLCLTRHFGKGNYVIVDTSGGYHVLVRTNTIKSNPKKFCNDVQALYNSAVHDFKKPEYVDEKGKCKFECVINNSQIPGLPLPGTYQYGREVRVLNKEDFDN